MPSCAAPLPPDYLDRLARLAGARTEVVHDVLEAAMGWPADVVAEAVARSTTRHALLDQLTVALIGVATPGQRAALEVAVRLGHWHPRLGTEPVQAAALRPWVVPSEGEWGWVRPVWRPPLRRALGGQMGLPPAPAARSAPVLTVGRRFAPAPGRPVLEARLLGPFELKIDGRAVERWNGPRGTQVLRFVLVRPRHACSRDELLEEFWPDVRQNASRNRLQVAVSGLRRTLAELTGVSVVQFVEGCYRINPEFQVVVDVEQHEQAIAAARRAQRQGDEAGARNALNKAVTLYRGDFVPDAPYGQWTLLPRETLRLAHLDTLDRLSRMQFAAGEVDECIATALRMLDADPCREDAHRLLMRCYAAQGRPYQALRQFDLCRRVLATAVGTGPDPVTVRLYREVRAGSHRDPALTE